MSVPSNVAAARQQAIETDFYALGYLALCIASYSDEGGTVSEIEQAIATNVPSLGQIGNVAGTWTLDWGPGISSKFLQRRANLVFVASYRDPSTSAPIFSAVVIRGTDISAGFLGLLTQLKEDLKPGCQLSWPTGEGRCASKDESASTTDAYVAKGTWEGFSDLITLTGTNQSTQQSQTLWEFLSGFLPQYADTTAPLPLVVTGHSLGGTLTAPTALYVDTQIASVSSLTGGVTVVPNSFAAATAGNPGFANLYLQTLPNARRWFNTFDLVPMAFDALANIDNLWSVAPYACGQTIPDVAKPILDFIEHEVRNDTYTHEAGSATRTLNGVCGSTSGTSKDPWGQQLEYQHFPPCGYWALMLSQFSSVLGSLAYPPWVKNPLAGCTSTT